MALQIGHWRRVASAAIERRLEAERDQLPLWLPVALGAGIAGWFALPDPRRWTAVLLALLAIACLALATARGGRLGRTVAVGGLAAALGLAGIWWRAEQVAAPVLARPIVAAFAGRVERVEALPARDLARFTLAPIDAPTLPGRVRVNIAAADVPTGATTGAVLRLRARLMPPAAPAVPGAYDFARVAWFGGLGATGRAFAPVVVERAGTRGSDLRERLSAHVRRRVDGSAGGIAAALVTGDVGGIDDPAAEAMRRSGLAHLLSISGLHVTAVVAATMTVVLRLLALSPWLALRVRLPLVAAAAAALVAIGYTLLTGAQVPTVRSCIAALLVLAAMALGREALTLRLVATGALAVLLVWPESLAGPSFQLSFAAITAIIALHEHPAVQRWFQPRGEPVAMRLARGAGSLLLTGLAVELALMPIAAYHFHKAGLYGALANIVAIPLTTFVVMPAEAAALVGDVVGMGAPFWWVADRALRALLWLAHTVAEAPGAVAALPAMPAGAFALMVSGGLWLALWRTGWRRFGAIALAAGACWTLATPAPDLVVTGDGRHVAVRTAGGLSMLRDRAGDYVTDMLAESGGVDGAPLLLSEQADARCSRDLCLVDRVAGERRWRILATRSAYLVPAAELIAACGAADVVISERRLPQACRPRWLKLDRPMLARTGGVAVTLATGRLRTVTPPGDRHPWRVPPRLSRSGATAPTAYPARGPAPGRNAADHRRGWRDRGGSSRPRDGNT